MGFRRVPDGVSVDLDAGLYIFIIQYGGTIC